MSNVDRPTHGPAPAPVVPGNTRPPAPAVREFGAPGALLRLVVGGAVEGAAQLIERLRGWEAQAMTPLRTREPTGEPTREPAGGATETERLRHALIGLLFLVERQAEVRASALVESGLQRRGEFHRSLKRLAEVPVLGLLVRPVIQAVDSANHTLDDELERWIRIGRLEERHGRALARIATSDLVAELFDRLAGHPALTDLMQQQSLGLAGGVIRNVRQAATGADERLEHLARQLLNGPGRDGPTGGENDSAASHDNKAGSV